jgi:hypothetical protein
VPLPGLWVGGHGTHRTGMFGSKSGSELGAFAFAVQICLFGLPIPCGSISDSMLVHCANGTPFVPVMLGIFVSGSCLHRQIWKHAARAGLCKTYAFCLLVGCYSACTIFFACFYLFIDLCYSAVS